MVKSDLPDKFDTVDIQRENLYKRLLGHYKSIFGKVNAVRSDSLDRFSFRRKFYLSKCYDSAPPHPR